MSFIKQFTDNLLSMEFRTISNMNDNTLLSDESKYMDPMSIVVNAVQLILSILIWYPFVKSYEKTYGNKEEETNAISAEDAAILDDLDLDF